MPTCSAARAQRRINADAPPTIEDCFEIALLCVEIEHFDHETSERFTWPENRRVEVVDEDDLPRPRGCRFGFAHSIQDRHSHAEHSRSRCNERHSGEESCAILTQQNTRCCGSTPSRRSVETQNERTQRQQAFIGTTTRLPIMLHRVLGRSLAENGSAGLSLVNLPHVAEQPASQRLPG